MVTWGIITAIVGVMMASRPVFHILRMRREHSSQGQSVTAILFGLAAFAVWLVYGIGYELYAIILTNIVGIAVETVWLLTVLHYRKEVE